VIQLRIADCGLRIAELAVKSTIRNPQSELNPQSAIRNPN